MTKAVATTDNALPAGLDNMMSGLANMQAAAQQDGSNRGSFMSYKKGTYIFGTEDMEPEDDSLWAVNPQSFRHGYQCWGKGKLIDEAVAGMGEVPIQKNQLDDTHTYVDKEGETRKAKWNALRGFQLVCTNGEDEGTQCDLSGTSFGMVKAIDGLIAEIVKHMREDASTPVAVITLGTDSYEHKEYGTVHFPVFEIVEFVAIDATATSADDDDEDGDEDFADDEHFPDEDEEEEEAPAPKPKRRRKAAKAAAEPEPEPAPAKRTRRRANAST